MARRLFDKLFGRPPKLPPDVTEALAELRRLAAERPALAVPAALLADLLPGLGTPEVTPPFSLAPDVADAKRESGIPLLRGEPFPCDPARLRRRWSDVCAVLRRHRPAADVEALADADRAGRLTAGEMAAAVLAGRPGEAHARADALGLDAGLAATVLRLALFPLLVPVAAALAPLRDGAVWPHGSCPTCGSWPLVGELRGLEQLRWLRCGLCATAWEYPRLSCPFCGTADHHALGYLHVEGEENRHRAATCEACRGYVKAVAVLDALSPPRLLVADLATLHLDLAAAARGYVAPS